MNKWKNRIIININMNMNIKIELSMEYKEVCITWMGK